MDALPQLVNPGHYAAAARLSIDQHLPRLLRKSGQPTGLNFRQFLERERLRAPVLPNGRWLDQWDSPVAIDWPTECLTAHAD
jgi:hypothetical protein